MSGSNNSEESEEAIRQYLADNGMLEDGMTAVEMRSVWEVVKISNLTAHAEEQDRQKRARRNLQIDEVSSRSELNSDKDKDEEEELPVATVLPQPRDNPLRSTAVVLPSCRSPTSTSVSSSSRHTVAPVSPGQQPLPAESYSRELANFSTEPLMQRSMRSKPVASQSLVNDVQEMSPVPEVYSSKSSAQNLQPSRNLKSPLSPRSIQNVSSPGQVQNAASPRSFTDVLSPRSIQNLSPRNSQNPLSPRESSPKNWSDVVRGNSKSVLSSSEPVMELSQDESPKTSDHESSPVRRIRKGFTLALEFQQADENIEDCSALNDNEKEKCDTVPSPASESSLNDGQSSDVIKKESDDRERNIDAFNCDRDNYDLTLKVRKPRRTSSRLPFYIPPYKMDVRSYITYFKKCVSDQAAKLLEIQKKSHKCIPWGDPVVVSESSDASVCVEQKNNTSSQQRYNFRERRDPHRKVHTIYEDPDSQNGSKTQDDSDSLFDSLLENDKPTDDLQIIRKDELSENSKPNTTPDRQGSKRKSESSEEMEEKRPASGVWLTAVKSEEVEVAVKRKKRGTVCYAGAERSWKNLGLEFIEDDLSSKEPLQEQNDKKPRKRKNRRKLYKKQQTIFEENDADEDETNILTELSEVEGAGSSRSHQEKDIIRPAPVKLRKQGRQRVLQTRQQQNEEEVSVVYDAAASSRNKEQEMEVPCPICRVTYPAKDIEAHASECNEYCAEEIPEDEEQSPSPQAPSEECWSQYDGVHETTSQGNHILLEAPSSPIRCFIPISAQQDTKIDYHNQFRMAPAVRRSTVKRTRGKKRKKKKTSVNAKKRKKTNTKQGCKVKEIQDYW